VSFERGNNFINAKGGVEKNYVSRNGEIHTARREGRDTLGAGRKSGERKRLSQTRVNSTVSSHVKKGHFPRQTRLERGERDVSQQQKSKEGGSCKK